MLYMVGKAPAFQFFHGVKVSAPLFGGFPFLAGGSLAVALCRVADVYKRQVSGRFSAKLRS